MVLFTGKKKFIKQYKIYYVLCTLLRVNIEEGIS